MPGVCWFRSPHRLEDIQHTIKICCIINNNFLFGGRFVICDFYFSSSTAAAASNVVYVLTNIGICLRTTALFVNVKGKNSPPEVTSNQKASGNC